MEIENSRNKGVKVLSKYTDSKQATLFEEMIFENSKNEEDYLKNVHHISNEISKDTDFKHIENIIINKKLDWEQECFDKIRSKIQEQDNFIQNPFNIAKGVLTCKCGSDRVFSYSKMTRSGDEAMTTFAECVKCKRKWTQS